MEAAFASGRDLRPIPPSLSFVATIMVDCMAGNIQNLYHMAHKIVQAIVVVPWGPLGPMGPN